jgi:formylglycine-generating enzyme required for sulfatase activity
MTVTEHGGTFVIKGGSWFSKSPPESCRAWSEQTIRRRDKRMDLGFRCVKPMFGNDHPDTDGD